MADYAISNVPRRVVYAASGTGPYAFTFEILAASDIAVYKGDTLLTLTTDYTVTINANGTGSVTLTATAGTSQITIVGAKNIQRTTDFTTGGDFFANTLNDELDAQTIYIQQVAETAERGLKAPVTDPTDINMTLPRKASRAGKTLAFDANGNPVPGSDIGDWRGNWASGTAYSVRDLVKDASNSNVYRVNTAHTSSGSTPLSTNANASKYDLVVDAAAAGTSATAAAASATAAASSASAASSSASSASTSASTATTKASEASTSASSASSSASTASTQATNAGNSATLASDWASKTTGQVASTDYSAKAWSIGGTGVTNTASAGAAKEWATKTGSTVDGTEYSAKKYAADAASSASSASSSASTATTQASNASSSASTATTQASNASASATLAQDWATKTSSAVSGGEYSAKYHAQAASTSASSASTQASNASTSASNAATSATAAQTAQAAAEAAYDSFDDRYLGAKSANPTVDNDGNALITGALHFNTTAGEMRIWNGTSWVAATVSPDTISERSFASTAGQTSYTFTGGYRVGYLYVWVNGVLLDAADITATNGTTVTFASALALNDEVRMLTFKAVGSVTIGDITGLQTALDAKAAIASSNTFSANQVISVTDNTNAALRVTQLGTGLAIRVEDETNPDTTPFAVTATGSVGIGTASPNDKLDVNGADAFIRVDRSNGEPGITLRYNGSTTNRGDIAVTSGGAMYFTAGGSTERMRIDSSGNVGVGTNSPSTYGKFVTYSSGGYAYIDTNGQIWSYQALDVATAGGRLTGGSNQGILGDIGIEQTTTGSKGGYIRFNTCAAGTNTLTERMRITSDGKVGIGTTSPSVSLQVQASSTGNAFRIQGRSSDGYGSIEYRNSADNTTYGFIDTNNAAMYMGTVANIPIIVYANNTERMRITSGGNVLLGTATNDIADANGTGATFSSAGNAQFSRASGGVVNINRKTDDGVIVYLQQDATAEGNISVSGTTVSYNGGHLARFTQLLDSTKDTSIVKGTVLSNLDEMCVYVNVKTGEAADNEQLNKVKVSDIDGDTNVAGVFVSWIFDETHGVDEINMAMTGDMIIRIAQGVTVQRGDLLMSAGDGTAKPQSDDIIRSKTIAKVTSTSVTCTYADGSYCVPCVLMAC